MIKGGTDMKKKLSVLALILAAVLLLSGCLGSETNEPTTTSGGAEETQAKLFFDTQTPLSLGYKLCYTNPADKEDPADEANVFGIAAENGSVIIAPQYMSIVPAGKNRFVVQRKVGVDYEEALVNENNEAVIPFFLGSLEPVLL